jgi:hypothetical protein
MKNLILALPVLVVLLFVACGGGGKKPKDVALSFANAMAKQDYETAKKYVIEDSKKAIDLVKGLAGEKKTNKVPNFVVVSESISGETATVKLKNTADGDKESEVSLEKVKGKWLVSMDKQQMINKDNNENNNNNEKKELKTQ